MLFILRLTNGDCVITMEADECSARQTAGKLSLDESHVVSVRQLSSFAVQLSPTEDGSLEVARWDDAMLDDVLANEYPLLDQAYRRANSAPFAVANDPEEPILSHLKSAYEQNAEIIREGLRLERQRFGHEGVPSKVKGA
jgi:hypothetical protein